MSHTIQGTRIHIYRWLNSARAKTNADEAALNSLPVLKTKKKWTKKIKPGVSTFGGTPELVGPDHLEGLVEHALDIIGEKDVPNTPIFLLATAGMRLLPDHERNAVLDNICSYMQKYTKFLLPDCSLHVQVIPGETEGLYGWIAANYLLGGFDAPAAHDHGKGHHTYGFLDMGGASAQIAFAPNAFEADKHADDLKLLRMRNVNGESVEYRVFVTTWLGYGVNEARKRYVEALLDASPGAQELPDPCLPSGLTVTKSGHVILPGSDEAEGKEAHLLGTGTFPECLRRTFPLLDKDAPCVEEPCLLHGVHVPAIDFDVNHFVGVSEYFHTTHSIFAMGQKDDVAYDFHTYQQRVTEFCSQDWQSIEKGITGMKWGEKLKKETAAEVCFKASWLINMLHDGIGIPRVGLESTKPKDGHFVNGTKEILDGAARKGFLDPFQAVDKIDGTEVSWTLGKMVLYAASQIAPADETKAVGFGSNLPGLATPKDFQYAGGTYAPLPDDLSDADNSLNEGSDWHDSLFTSGSSARRLPGIILFALICLLAAFLLCGRDRRQTLYNRLRSPFSSSKSRRRRLGGSGLNLTSKLFGGHNSNGARSASYERVELGDPAEFELGDMGATGSSDSDSDHSLAGQRPPSIRSISGTGPGGNGRTSGWATPKPGFASPALSHSSPKRTKNSSYFDGSMGGGPVPMPSVGEVSGYAVPGTPGLGIGESLGGGFGGFGMGSRTVSMERLAPGPMLRSASRNGSRAASPRRSGFGGMIKEGME